jgi:dihydroflavonol-4-reductase
VLHVASPFPPVQPKDPDELIVPARDGALRVLRAAGDAGAGRSGVTSSGGAIRGTRPSTPETPWTEADWTDGNDTSRTPYVRSKTLAEQAAWELVRSAGHEDRLAVVNPGAIIGPALNDDHSYSLQAIQRLLGGMPAAPRLGFTFVDVRDVADLHIRAMTSAAAGGGRFIATDEFMWMPDVANVLRERL